MRLRQVMFRQPGLAPFAQRSACEPIARIGRYDLEQLIGRGGMGLVFRAWDTQLHRVVAVKSLGMSLWAMPAGARAFYSRRPSGCDAESSAYRAQVRCDQ